MVPSKGRMREDARMKSKGEEVKEWDMMPNQGNISKGFLLLLKSNLSQEMGLEFKYACVCVCVCARARSSLSIIMKKN